MICYAIRKKSWFKILKEFPVFKVYVEHKFFSFYLMQIYQPLKLLRQSDIDFYKRRKDYVQVFALKDCEKFEMLDLLDKIFMDDTEY